MRRSHACRRDGRGAEQPDPVHHVHDNCTHANHDRSHANDNRGLNRDPWTGDDHDNATAY